jgi:hypothetical protein
VVEGALGRREVDDIIIFFAFSRDDSQLVVGTEGSRVRVVDAATCEAATPPFLAADPE